MGKGYRDLCILFLLSVVFNACTSELLFSSSELNDNDDYLSKETPAPDYEKVKLTVFYESLCPYCIEFFNQQLRPTYLQLNRYIKLDLVPYGNAQQNFTEGHWHFICQHGPLECEYNKLHACALKLLKQESKSFRFISCLMVDKNETAHLHKCAMENKVELEPIDNCRKSSMGDNLLAKFGNRTHSFRPPIEGVPTVAFNNIYTEKDEEEALVDLRKVICKHLKVKPRICED